VSRFDYIGRTATACRNKDLSSCNFDTLHDLKTSSIKKLVDFSNFLFFLNLFKIDFNQVIIENKSFFAIYIYRKFLDKKCMHK
jgi:hypothetical protein